MLAWSIVCTIKSFKSKGGRRARRATELGNFMSVPVRAPGHKRAWGDFVQKKHPAV